MLCCLGVKWIEISYQRNVKTYFFISPVYQHDYENCRRIQEVFFESDGKEGKEKEEDSRQTAKW